MAPVRRRPAHEEEEALALSAASGEREAFGELVRRFEAPLLRFLLVRCGSHEDAEELCQESFLRAWQRIDRYDPRWRFSTWLFTVARRLAISRRRAADPTAVATSVEQLGVEREPGEEVARRERRDNLWSMAERLLGEDQRTALWLRYAEGFSADEIGRVVGRRAPAVRVMLHRARAVLAEHLDPSLADEPRVEEDPAPFLPAVRAGQMLEGGS